MKLPAFLRRNTAPQVIKRVVKMKSFRSFAAASYDRLMAGFRGTSLSINESLRRDLDTMRHRSRELWHDNDYGKKFIRMVRNNVVGAKGIRLQARSLGSDGLPDTMDNDAIEAAYMDFGKKRHCTVTGMLTMADVQRICIAAAAGEGEAFIRFVTGRDFKYGVALQLIEADMLDTQLNYEPAGGTGNRIIMGIEVNEWGRPINYYFLSNHPSESVAINGKKYVVVDADDVVHVFIPERVNQMRGIPWMHSSIKRLNMVGGYEEAELVAARAGASKMGFYETETGGDYQGDDTEADGTLIEEVEPGLLGQLPHGTKFVPFDPQHPTGAFNYFMKGVLQGAAAGLGVAYTSFSGNLEAVNYSSIRAGLVEERESWREIQQWYIEHCVHEIFDKWLVMALTMGAISNAAGVKLPISKIEKFRNVRWQARGWAWVDPLKDQQANNEAVAAGHMTNSEVIASRGGDIEDVYETLQWEKQLAAKYGLEISPKRMEDKTDDKDDEEDDKDSNNKDDDD